MTDDEAAIGETEFAGALADLDWLVEHGSDAEVVDKCNQIEAQLGQHFEVYYRRAHAKAILRDISGALADLSSAILLNPAEPALFFFRGLWALDLDWVESAAGDLARAISAEEVLGASYYSRTARFVRAIALLALRRFDLALAECAFVDKTMKYFVAGRLWEASEIQALAEAGLQRGRAGQK